MSCYVIETVQTTIMLYYIILLCIVLYYIIIILKLLLENFLTKSDFQKGPKLQIICHVISCHVILYRIVLYRIVSYRIVLHCIILYCIVLLCCVVLCCIVLCCIVQWRILGRGPGGCPPPSFCRIFAKDLQENDWNEHSKAILRDFAPPPPSF